MNSRTNVTAKLTMISQCKMHIFNAKITYLA